MHHRAVCLSTIGKTRIEREFAAGLLPGLRVIRAALHLSDHVILAHSRRRIELKSVERSCWRARAAELHHGDPPHVCIQVTLTGPVLMRHALSPDSSRILIYDIIKRLCTTHARGIHGIPAHHHHVASSARLASLLEAVAIIAGPVRAISTHRLLYRRRRNTADGRQPSKRDRRGLSFLRVRNKDVLYVSPTNRRTQTRLFFHVESGAPDESRERKYGRGEACGRLFSAWTDGGGETGGEGGGGVVAWRV